MPCGTCACVTTIRVDCYSCSMVKVRAYIASSHIFLDLNYRICKESIAGADASVEALKLYDMKLLTLRPMQLASSGK